MSEPALSSILFSEETTVFEAGTTASTINCEGKVFDAAGGLEALQPQPRFEECSTAWGRRATEEWSELQLAGLDLSSARQEQMPVQQVPAGWSPIFIRLEALHRGRCRRAARRCGRCR